MIKNIIISILIGLLLAISIIFYIFHYEAKYQLPFSEDNSKGECRYKNTAYAYDNNLGFEGHRITFKSKPSEKNNFKESIETVIHVYAVDKDKKIYDVSNGTRILGVSYDEYMKGNIISDELLFSGKLNKNEYDFTIVKFWSKDSLSSFLALKVYYCTYKLNR